MMKRTTTFGFLAGTLALAASACGDDSGKCSGAECSGPTDAAVSQVDAGPMGEVGRSGQIAVTENTFIGEGLPDGLKGATIAVGWTDKATAKDPLEGFESNIGGCRITVYDLASEKRPTQTDEGPVSIKGTSHGEVTCAFQAEAKGYACQIVDPAAAGSVTLGSTAKPGLRGHVIYAIDGVTFDPRFVGAQLSITGFADPKANGTFPVVSVNNNGSLIVYSAAQTGQTTSTAAGGTYATFVGAGPIPGGFEFLTAESELAISKAASEEVAAIELPAFNPAGEGFKLNSMMSQPDAFPSEPEAVTFSCTDGGGACGDAGSATLNPITISGEASDGALDPTKPAALSEAATKYASFQCSGIEATTGVSMSSEAVAAILAIDPTRVRVSVGRMTASIEEAGDARTNVLAGNMITGFTTLQ